MTKFKIEKGVSRIARVKLQATVEESTAKDLALLCDWSNNEKNYVVNQLLRFALSQDFEFQSYKQSLSHESVTPLASSGPSTAQTPTRQNRVPTQSDLAEEQEG